MFQVGEAVVYAGFGAGRVVEVAKLSSLGSGKRYYEVELIGGSKTQVWVPVKDAEERGLRRPASKTQMRRIWRRLRSKPETLPSDHQSRYEVLRQKLDNGDALQVAEALRDLSWKDCHVRKLTSEGKRLYEKGMKLLSTEIAVAEEADPDSVEDRISLTLEENAARREAPA